MTFRFRHNFSVAAGVRLKAGQRGINLSDMARAQALFEHDQQGQVSLSMPSTGLHYVCRFDNTRAHQHRAFQLRQQQKWQSQAYEASVQLDNARAVPAHLLSVTFSDAGQLCISTPEGDRLSDADLAKLCADQPDLVRLWLEQEAAEVNGVLSEYLQLHSETPKPDSQMPSYVPAPFVEPEPQRPDPLKLPAEPVYPQPPAIRFWHRLVPGRQQQMVRAHQQAVHEWQTSKLRWKAETHQAKSASDRARQRYKAYASVWKARKLAHDTEQQVYAEQFATLLLNDESVMTEVLMAELDQLDWPRQTLIDFQLNLDSRCVWLDLDLPTVDLISPKMAQVAAQGQMLHVRDKPAIQRQREYARHLHASLVRVMGVLFASLPAIDQVVVSGYTPRINPDTGFEQDDYLISVRASRQAFSALDFTQLDQQEPQAILEQFELRREYSETEGFKAIDPFHPE
ncbi:DUF4236 domain-containing protein [Nitrincola lacisaponensis]|uniref:DUF4236 domain-containing protein n=1 Tax=Nitrincola lacisaponensis TaxID=267850 RepID=UPI001268C4C4|nr:DUF4236 domain-containing protein [Nitrincola lacisaponensis]